MTSLLGRVFVTLRAWLGLSDPSDHRLHAAHGWLLPALAPRALPLEARAAADVSGPRR